MKLTRTVWLFVLVFVFAAAARANTIDPGIGLGGSGSCATASQTSLTQTLTGLPTEQSTGACIIDVTNNVPGATLISITVTVDTAAFFPAGSTLSCFTFFGTGGTKPFSVATMSGPNSCTFSGPPGFVDAVSPLRMYGLQFLNGPGNTLSAVDVTLAASTVPEPATILLLGTGLAGLVTQRRRLKGVASKLNWTC